MQNRVSILYKTGLLDSSNYGVKKIFFINSKNSFLQTIQADQR